FFLESDDVSLLYIDGTLVVDNGRDHGPQTGTGSANLTAGRHCFEVQFHNSESGSGVNLHLPDGVSYVSPALNCPSDVMFPYTVNFVDRAPPDCLPISRLAEKPGPPAATYPCLVPELSGETQNA